LSEFVGGYRRGERKKKNEEERICKGVMGRREGGNSDKCPNEKNIFCLKRVYF